MNILPRTENMLIVTATKVESQAILQTFSPDQPPKRRIVGNKTYFDLGLYGGVSAFLVQSEMGIGTPGGALLTVRNAIDDLQPQAIIMCGIACGLRRKKQKLGDILVSRQLEYYDPAKMDIKLGKIPRSDRVMASERLLDRFRSAELVEWTGAPVSFGLILSGEKLVNDSNFCAQLIEIEPEALGVEMEGAGLYAAARGANVDWILVKAICDWGDGKKNAKAQPSAASNAAQFVLHMLHQGGWDRNFPNTPTTQSISITSEMKQPKISINNQQQQLFESALLSAFPMKSSLTQMLQHQLGKNLEAIAGTGSLQTVVFDLIKTARAQGWLVDLIIASRRENPGNPELIDFCNQVGLIL